ncbi:MAG: YvcK family protein [Oscillospiraceae bacterium]|nr:YvcK family protein [Oscillospiraceae bacterium]
MNNTAPKITCIGGGTGLSTMLRGLKRFSPNITAIVTVTDDGGGSGVLRTELAMPPPGDIRSCLLALSNTEPTMAKLLNYRFTGGHLKGQSFGNLFLAAMHGISGSFDEAVAKMADVLAITGRVLPVTNENVWLTARFADGSRIFGESNINYAKLKKGCRITSVALSPKHPKALPESIRAIEEADIIVLGPGSLYTSVIPNLLVDGITDAICTCRGTKIYVCNLMTQPGETEGYTVSDHVSALLMHSGCKLVDYCIVNSNAAPEAMVQKYKQEGSTEVKCDYEVMAKLGIKVVRAPISFSQEHFRHNPLALAAVIMDIYKNNKKE